MLAILPYRSFSTAFIFRVIWNNSNENFASSSKCFACHQIVAQRAVIAKNIKQTTKPDLWSVDGELSQFLNKDLKVFNTKNKL